ncbi:MAG: hypothetical protein ABSC53_08080 [Bacteroidota bacterium]
MQKKPNVAVALRSRQTNISTEAQTLAALLQHPNALFTPHNTFNTIEAVKRKS